MQTRCGKVIYPHGLKMPKYRETDCRFQAHPGGGFSRKGGFIHVNRNSPNREARRAEMAANKVFKQRKLKAVVTIRKGVSTRMARGRVA